MFDFSEYGFSEEASLEANEWIDHTEWLDFVACMRPDGSVYGTGGKCRAGKEVSLQSGEGMPKIAGKARAAGMKQQRVKEIADAVRAKYGGKQVRGDALQSVVRRINEDLAKKGGDPDKARKKLESLWKQHLAKVKAEEDAKKAKKQTLDEALSKAEKEAKKATSSGAKKGLTEDVGRKFPRKDENWLKHPEDKERGRGRLDQKFLDKLNERQLKRLEKEASLNEGQKNKIKAEIAKREGKQPTAPKESGGGALKVVKQPGGGYKMEGADGKAVGYLNKGPRGWRAYDAGGNMLNNYRNLSDAKAGLAKKVAHEARELKKEEAKGGPEAAKLNAKFKEAKFLGSGAMGEVRRNPGPPPSIVKKGEIGENEVAALKKLAGTGVAPKLNGDVMLGESKATRGGLGGHVTAAKGIIDMSEAKGKPVGNIYGENNQHRIERLNSLMDARAKMHLAGVAHNDMHTGNVFYDGGTKKSTIVDFGLSQIGFKYALSEAIGTNRGGDYQSEGHFDSRSARDNSPQYRRFEMNRDRIIKKYNLSSSDLGRIRSKDEDLPSWIQKLSEKDAENLVKELYKGV